MLGRLNHVAIAVPDLEAAARKYRNVLGANVSEPQALPEHGLSRPLHAFARGPLVQLL